VFSLLDDTDAMVEGGRGRELHRLLVARLPETIIISASRSDALADLHRHSIEIGPSRPDRGAGQYAFAWQLRVATQTVTSSNTPIAAIAAPAVRAK
jgi:ABC-type uncharacterized transport system fused permease/ATPase subunit